MGEMAVNLKKIVFMTAVVIVLLVCRLAYIQLVGGDELAEATRAQSMIALEGSNTRGIIYDRNGSPLVADDEKYIYIIKADRFTDRAEAFLKELGAEEVDGNNDNYVVSSSESYDREMGKRLIEETGAYILQASARYSDSQTAAHLIGYVNRRDASGAAGLELMYDEVLSGLNKRIYAVADVKGNILPGRGLMITADDKEDSYVKDGIRTTVDKGIQQAVEDIIDEMENNCAVVVLDSRTGGVTAMASTPGFDPDHIDSHIASQGDELMNRATQGEYAPGSVFKIAVAAAALEKGIDIGQEYECSGSVKAGSLTIGCETGGDAGHGTIGFEDAFAQSCNSFFIKLGQQTGADEIVEMAEKLGLGRKAIDGYPQESSGHLMTKQERSGDAIGNLSIGQGETLVTPVQVARMTNIIASEGMDRGVHLLVEDEADDELVISKETARTIGEMMESVTETGTGAGLDLSNEGGGPEAAIKTGTAEYGSEDSVGTHGWVTGYTPCDEPEYVITVLVEGGSSGSSSAGPVFEEIVEYLRKSGSYSRPALA